MAEGGADNSRSPYRLRHSTIDTRRSRLQRDENPRDLQDAMNRRRLQLEERRQRDNELRLVRQQREDIIRSRRRLNMTQVDDMEPFQTLEHQDRSHSETNHDNIHTVETTREKETVTLNENELAEEDRIRERLSEIERKRNQVNFATEDGSLYTPAGVIEESFITVDEVGRKLDDFNLTLEEMRLDEKLLQLEGPQSQIKDNRRMSDPTNKSKEDITRKTSELEKSIRYLEEDVCFQGKHSYMDEFETKSKTQQEHFEKWSSMLERKEEVLSKREQQMRIREREIDESLKQRHTKLQIQEDRLVELQRKMEQRFVDMERTLRDKSETWRSCTTEQIKRENNANEERNERFAHFDENGPRQRMISPEEYFQQFERYNPTKKEVSIPTDFLKQESDRGHQKGHIEDLDERIKELQNQRALICERTEKVKVESPAERNAALSVKLNLTPFSGKEPVPKNEASFEEFKLEFDSVREIYSEQVLKQALRKSLRDQARKVMLHLGAGASVSNIMQNLEETFGNVASEDSLLSKFLLAEQKNEESIVEWSLRLEELVLQIERKSRMDSEDRKAMLKKRFWRGLKNDELKQATRVHFESKMPYEELRNRVRAEEYEIQLQRDRSTTKTKMGKVNQTAVETHTKTTNEAIETLMRKIESMDKKLEELTKAQEGPHERSGTEPVRYTNFGERGRGYTRGYSRGYRRGSSSTRRNGYGYREGMDQRTETLDKKQTLNQ